MSIQDFNGFLPIGSPKDNQMITLPCIEKQTSKQQRITISFPLDASGQEIVNLAAEQLKTKPENVSILMDQCLDIEGKVLTSENAKEVERKIMENFLQTVGKFIVLNSQPYCLYSE